MPNTPKYALPYPSPGVAPDVPVYMQQLAEGVEAKTVGSSTAKSGKRMHWGSATVTTDSGGMATVTHGAGFTPTVVVLQLARATGNLYTDIAVDSITATTFRCRPMGADGSIAVSMAGIPIFYFCGE
jgi:hypothetical protein